MVDGERRGGEGGKEEKGGGEEGGEGWWRSGGRWEKGMQGRGEGCGECGSVREGMVWPGAGGRGTPVPLGPKSQRRSPRNMGLGAMTPRVE